MVLFVCPACGKTLHGDPMWKQYCACRPVIQVTALEWKRDVTEMIPEIGIF